MGISSYYLEIFNKKIIAEMRFLHWVSDTKFSTQELKEESELRDESSRVYEDRMRDAPYSVHYYKCVERMKECDDKVKAMYEKYRPEYEKNLGVTYAN